ncbi:hypothetical protein D3C81_2135130 [compost metagenome]
MAADQPGGFELAHMHGHNRTAELEGCGQLLHVHGLIGQQPQHMQAHGTGQGLVHGQGLFG